MANIFQLLRHKQRKMTWEHRSELIKRFLSHTLPRIEGNNLDLKMENIQDYFVLT